MKIRNEALDGAAIAGMLGACPVFLRIYDEIDSTNSEAKRYALNGGAAPAAFLAERQSAGRGRMGRSFYSPAHTGVYLSLLLPMRGELSDAVLLTSASAVAVHRAILRATGIETKIKWVNDLYYRDRKVCGILAESFCCGEERHTVLGVGVNLYTEEFPEELAEIAGALAPADGGLRNRLAAAMIEELYAVATDLHPSRWLETYRGQSLCLGKPVTYTENGVTRSALAEELDERGRLWVRREDGVRACLASGEISLRVHEKQRKSMEMAMENKRGRLIVLEGIDGAGKTTQAALLEAHLRERGREVFRTAEPTGFPSGVALRQALGGEVKKSECEMAVMFVLDRIAHNIHPTEGLVALLERGVDIICDRYYYSNLAYQGQSTDYEWVREMNLRCPQITKPDLCIYLDLKPEQSLERIRAGRDHVEIYENRETLECVRNAFLSVLRDTELTERVEIVDAYRAPEEIATEIAAAVDSL